MAIDWIKGDVYRHNVNTLLNQVYLQAN